MFSEKLKEMAEFFASSKTSLEVPREISYIDPAGNPVFPEGSIKGIVFFGTSSEVIECLTVQQAQERNVAFVFDNNGHITMHIQEFRMKALLSVGNRSDLFHVVFAVPANSKAVHDVEVCSFFLIEDYLYKKWF